MHSSGTPASSKAVVTSSTAIFDCSRYRLRLRLMYLPPGRSSFGPSSNGPPACHAAPSPVKLSTERLQKLIGHILQPETSCDQAAFRSDEQGCAETLQVHKLLQGADSPPRDFRTQEGATRTSEHNVRCTTYSSCPLAPYLRPPGQPPASMAVRRICESGHHQVVFSYDTGKSACIQSSFLPPCTWLYHTYRHPRKPKTGQLCLRWVHGCCTPYNYLFKKITQSIDWQIGGSPAPQQHPCQCNCPSSCWSIQPAPSVGTQVVSTWSRNTEFLWLTCHCPEPTPQHLALRPPTKRCTCLCVRLQCSGRSSVTKETTSVHQVIATSLCRCKGVGPVTPGPS